jgi:hypothetical protein
MMWMMKSSSNLPGMAFGIPTKTKPFKNLSWHPERKQKEKR